MELQNIDYVVKIGVECIELYIGFYVDYFYQGKEKVILDYIIVGKCVLEFGFELNVGYDLNQDNLCFFKQLLFDLVEVFIGYVLILDVLYLGLENMI